MSSSQGNSLPVSGASRSDLKPSEVLAKAADLIEPEGRWTQGAFARSRPGKKNVVGTVWPRKRVCWCARGALFEVVGSSPVALDVIGEDYLERAIGGEVVPAFNDEPERTQAEVVAALRKAAKLARAEGQ